MDYRLEIRIISLERAMEKVDKRLDDLEKWLNENSFIPGFI